MPMVTVARELIVRTTSEHRSHVHGLAVGAGEGLDAALMDLEREARRQADEIALTVQDAAADSQPDASWRFEVVGMRLAAGHPGDPHEAFVAYGTLISYGRTPWSASYWDGPDAR